MENEILNIYNESIDNDLIYIKHFKNMTKEERLYLFTLKDKLLNRGVHFAQHALSRMDERFIKEKDVLRALKNGQILEYKKIETDELIIVRGCHVNRRDEQIYVVFSIKQNKVITTYSNKHWVVHKKLNCSKYTKDFYIDIPEFYKNKIKFFT